MAEHKDNSQYSLILRHLETGAEINPLEALSMYGCYRLGAVIFNLKKDGYSIMTRIHRYAKPSGREGHYAIYKLIPKENKK